MNENVEGDRLLPKSKKFRRGILERPGRISQSEKDVLGRDQAQKEDEPRAKSKLWPRKKGPHYSQLMIGVQSARLDGGWCQDDMHP